MKSLKTYMLGICLLVYGGLSAQQSMLDSLEVLKNKLVASSNMALICERVNRYEDAIFNMKKYLLLEPNADDSRKAQDKVYEWEYQIINKNKQ